MNTKFDLGESVNIEGFVKRIDIRSTGNEYFVSMKTLDGSENSWFKEEQLIKKEQKMKGAKMKEVELYFSDLNESGQNKLLEAVNAEKPSDMNWDMDIIPIAILHFEEE